MINIHELERELHNPLENHEEDSPRNHEEYPSSYPFDVGDSYICLSDLKEDQEDSFICLSDLKEDLSYNVIESPRNSLDALDDCDVGNEEQVEKMQEIPTYTLEETNDGKFGGHSFIKHKWWYFGYEENGGAYDKEDQFTVFHPP